MTTPIPASEEQVVAACEPALRLAPSEWTANLPAPGGLLGSLGVSEWHALEHDAWAIGESIRRAFVQSPKLRKRTAPIGKVAKVATYRNLRCGRQSFVMAMGFVDACQYAAALVPFVDDPDVDGQIVDTLLKMRAAGYTHAVGGLLRSEKAWIRRLARKYIERYPTKETLPTS